MQRDEGLRETSLEKLATLKPVAREDGVHTAGNSSQISDGAAAVLMMTEARAAELGLRPRARVVDTCLVGVDPVLMLTGPIDATQRLLDRTGLAIDDIATFEINEAFASVVLAWAKEFGADLDDDQPQRRRHRPRPPARGHRCVPDDEGAQRARAHRRPLRPDLDVLRRRPRHRHDHRTDLIRPPDIDRRRPVRSDRVQCRRTPASPIPCDTALLSLVVLLGCAGPSDRRTSETVTAVVDGDTIDVRINGADERVRLLGIDTPEVHRRDGGPPDCFGPQASTFTATLLPAGTEVRLVRDVVGRDDYGRLLAYVYRTADGCWSTKSSSVRVWPARYASRPNGALAERFVAAAFAAEASGLGLWASCGG